MAIYSLNVGSVGKTTHAAGTAGAHVRYIARPSAASDIFAHVMPDNPNAARAWVDRAEEADRKNARVLDRIRIAIPRELSREDRQRLVREFCQEITGNRVPWLAAIHQDGDDAHNPHVHIVVRDRDIEAGKRVLKWSDSARDRKAAGMPENAVEMIRERWEVRANDALARAGHQARIDRRSLEAQGLDRAPTIHIGPNASHIETFVQRPESKIVTERRGARERTIDYPMIDAGRTRKERHAEIIDLNLERAARSPDFPTRARAQLQREEMLKDRNLERQLITDARRLTLEERRLREAARTAERKVQAQARSTRADIDARFKATFLKERDAMRSRQAQAREALKAEQSRLTQRVMRTLDLTGSTRRRHTEARRALVSTQYAERRALVSKTKEARATLQGDVAAIMQKRITGIRQEARTQLDAFAARRATVEAAADTRRQARAAERAQAEANLEEQLRQAERMRRDQEEQSRQMERARPSQAAQPQQPTWQVSWQYSQPVRHTPPSPPAQRPAFARSAEPPRNPTPPAKGSPQAQPAPTAERLPLPGKELPKIQPAPVSGRPPPPGKGPPKAQPTPTTDRPPPPGEGPPSPPRPRRPGFPGFDDGPLPDKPRRPRF